MSNNGSHNNGSHSSTRDGKQGGVQTATDTRQQVQGTQPATTSGAEEAKSCPIAGVNWFVKDYIGRHSHPVNAALHIVGVPAAFTGFFLLFSGKDVGRGALLVFVGYLFQFLGHQAQGNEVGEVTLMKNVYKRIQRNRF
ncbi:MAG: Mpo1-like protein [Candidatus Melainabacteria bacterium]|nr:Mpo1-like protein [Candidatus Melainabacteria bacterium]